MFFYGNELARVAHETGVSCPNNTNGANGKGFRFVKEPLSVNSFIPVSMKSPARKHSDAVTKCSVWGLSMYDSEVNCFAAYKKLQGTHKNIGKTLGEHYAEGSFTILDGVFTTPNNSGHFDFHPYKSFDPLKTFVLRGKIV